MTTQSPPDLRGRSRLLTRLGLAALIAAAVARGMLFTTYNVTGGSMRESLKDGDRILVSARPWLFGPPLHGQAVVADVAGEVLVKRLAALPGDRVAMQDGRLYRNGELVAEMIPEDLCAHDDFPEWLLGEDEFFLLGDNRRVSIDSRDFGPVRSWQIRGTVMLRMGGGGLSSIASLAP